MTTTASSAVSFSSSLTVERRAVNSFTADTLPSFVTTKVSVSVDACIAAFGPFIRFSFSDGILIGVKQNRRDIVAVDAFKCVLLWEAHIDDDVDDLTIFPQFVYVRYDAARAVRTYFIRSGVCVFFHSILSNPHGIDPSNTIEFKTDGSANCTGCAISRVDAKTRREIVTNRISWLGTREFLNDWNIQISAHRKYLLLAFTNKPNVFILNLQRSETLTLDKKAQTNIRFRVGMHARVFEFSPRYDNILLARCPRYHKVFDIEADTTLYTYENGSHSVRFSIDGDHLLIERLVHYQTIEISVYSLRHRRTLFAKTFKHVSTFDVSGRFLFVSTRDDTSLYDLRSNDVIATIAHIDIVSPKCAFSHTFDRHFRTLYVEPSFPSHFVESYELFDIGMALFDAALPFFESNSLPVYVVLDIVEFLPGFSNASRYVLLAYAQRLHQSCKQKAEKRGILIRP